MSVARHTWPLLMKSSKQGLCHQVELRTQSHSGRVLPWFGAHTTECLVKWWSTVTGADLKGMNAKHYRGKVEETRVLVRRRKKRRR